MKRGDAGKALRECTYLTAPERLVFLVLLEQADNADCSLPYWVRPTLPELVTWTSQGRSTVVRALSHLEKHGWVLVERGRGRGHRSNYRLVPNALDHSCHCEKVPHRDPSKGPKGTTGTPFETGKGVPVGLERSRTGTEKVSERFGIPGLTCENPQGIQGREGEVDPTFAERLAAYHRCEIKDCGSTEARKFGPHRLCREHAGSQWKESA